MILTTAQLGAFQRAIAAANNVLPKVELIEHLAAVAPALQARAQELRSRMDYLRTLAEAAISFNDSTRTTS